MKKFMDENFLLTNSVAETLYHDYSEKMPIIDYHCHINPKEILEDKKFKNITQVWLYGDHYKWRQMRTFGIDEKFITGDGSDYEKFLAYTRHELFRRILCNVIGEWVENGEFPSDMQTLGTIISDISYNNAERYFDFVK